MIDDIHCHFHNVLFLRARLLKQSGNLQKKRRKSLVARVVPSTRNLIWFWIYIDSRSTWKINEKTNHALTFSCAFIFHSRKIILGLF